ncbi:MAG: amino acid ABC transporter permease [Cupriavidus sp.]|jgi:cystine transport system permease protein|uniref:amino acid ABC transporter permease n=1 Tax=Cupriavidus pauculus TaxID=82633 RepID=UPI00078406FC|nr:amino acid ABC transporter permease [Cupriavidus pauculus]MBU68103.1 amino acid ABC transporter permease [Cupriavidus sp.]KAB0604729.1 amino acid ABC transporter permease [Cupriavidus pauculus]MBY4729944.1 amino acid ABC transporter permease [Cupriavidus pauculus]MCM3604791.1 amino acid ABC transporter permease [Cupriavidus pauculus]UAK98837.1 amino acid ABC transporter permease [Cupriavidus pauculus]
MSALQLVIDSLPVLLQGTLLTLKFAVLSMVFGLLIGIVVALMGIGHQPILKAIARVYVSIMRGTPLLVQIFVVYYGLPGIGIALEPTPAGVLTLSLNVGAYLSESMRGAILGVPRGQWLAAYSLGMAPLQTLRYVVGPQALRLAVPSLSNSLISLIKDTSLVSVITVTELLRTSQEIIAATYQPLPLYLAAAAIYWILSTALSALQHVLERRLALPGRH